MVLIRRANKTKGPGLWRGAEPDLAWLVAHTGVEPVISSLRGRCPGPLDECATLWLGDLDSNQGSQIQSLLSYH